jgi:hypothetical protein
MKQISDATKPGFVGATKRFQPFGNPLKKALYDDEEFIVVEGTWKSDDESEPEDAIACRWYGFNPTLPEDEQGKGYPNGYGRAQWLVLPEYIGLLIATNYMKRKMELTRPKLII